MSILLVERLYEDHKNRQQSNDWYASNLPLLNTFHQLSWWKAYFCIYGFFFFFSANGSILNRQPIPLGNMPPATVKVVRLLTSSVAFCLLLKSKRLFALCLL